MRSLHIGGTHITDKGVVEILDGRQRGKERASNSSLKDLDLRGLCMITDEGLIEALRFQCPHAQPSIGTLIVNGCTRLSALGIQNLKREFPNVQIHGP